MSINIFTHSDQAELAGFLSKKIDEVQTDIFKPIYILSPSAVQDSWIKEQMAENIGVIANITFMRPEAFFNWLSYKVDSEKVEKLNPSQIEWAAFEILGSENFQNRFPIIQQYCLNDDVKRFALAQKAVQLIYKYQEYREELLFNRHADEDWQVGLYLQLVQNFDDLLVHLPVDYYSLLEAMEDSDTQNWLKNEVPALYIWGANHLSPYYLKLLQAMNEEILINLYLSQKYGADESVTSLESEFNHTLKEYFPEAMWYGTMEQASLDYSKIEFHACHTVQREVEALYNYLVRTVDSNPRIGARDIQVLVPQLENYVASIQAVFENAPYKFPYQILGKGLSQEESYWNALASILKMEKEDFAASVIFNLIEKKQIKESFGFEDLELVRNFIHKAKIRREKEGREQTQTRYHSWDYGLKRLIYGFCLGEENLFNDGKEEFYPLDMVEGKEAQELFRLYHFVDLLWEMTEEKGQPRTLKEWVDWVDEVMQKFLEPDPTTAKIFQYQLQELAAIAEHLNEKISFQVFFFKLKDMLAQLEDKAMKGFGGVTFCKLTSANIVPKKVIALLGMNFNDFPRKEKPLSFDFMQQFPRQPLDPSIKLSDQDGFNRAICSAQEGLYISWLGQSDLTNVELPASILVEELLDKAATALPEKKELVVRHPLHGYSLRYNQNRGPLINYLQFEGEEADFKKALTSDEDPCLPETLMLKDLENFLKDPFKYYYNRVLGIYYGEEERVLENTEAFGLDKLGEWGIKNELIFSPEAEKQVRKELGMKGKIPLASMGTLTVSRLGKEVSLMKQAFISLNQGTDLHSDSLKLEALGLAAEMEIFPSAGYYYLTPSSNKPKHKLAVYLRLLFLQASGITSELTCFTSDFPEGKIMRLPLTQEEAETELKWIMELYLKAQQKLVPLYLEFDFKAQQVESWETFKLKWEIDKKMSSDYFYPSKYLQKAYHLGYFESERNLEEFKELYVKFCQAIESLSK